MLNARLMGGREGGGDDRWGLSCVHIHIEGGYFSFCGCGRCGESGVVRNRIIPQFEV